MSTHYDVLVIGGGIQGAGIAQASAAAGFKTLIIEKNTWGSGTSSKSSKLIHGGLRYLQTAQFSLVRESLAERNWMIKHIPDLVKPNWFYIPIYKENSFHPWKIATGLSMYQMLCGFSQYSSFKKLPKSQWPDLSGLNTDDLEAVYAYQDAQTNDKVLTQRVIESAKSLGAECMENCTLTKGAVFDKHHRVCFEQEGTEHCVKASIVINATGPWVNHTLACFKPALEPINVDLIQGTHIVIDERMAEECYYLEAPSDKRAVFVMPWEDKTMIGTTETLYEGHPDNCEPLQEEIDYLINTVKHYFPDQTMTVSGSFSGLRVLPKGDGRAFSRPRDVQIRVDGQLFSVYGGKLTGWRHTAEMALEAIEFTLGKRQTVDTYKLSI